MPILDDLESGGAPWPPEGHADRIDTQEDHARLYRNRRDEILQRWSADLLRWVDGQDELIPFPSGRIVAHTLAAFLFGDDPSIRHENRETQGAIDALSTETNLPARLLEGAITQAVEGEVYLRPAWDRDLSPWPITTAIPGSQVIPTFRHGMLREAAIVTTWTTDRGNTYRRLIEAHERGGITYRLYLGTADRLGRQIPLDGFAPTADLADEEEVETQIDELLVTHVPVGRASWGPHGVSIFDGLEAMMLALHRLYSQEQHDAELSRKRVAMPASYVDRDSAGRARFDRRTDLFLLSSDAEGAIGSDKASVHPIEFRDDNVQRDRIRGRLEDLLIACGISPYTIVAKESGGATSGTARKLAQATTLRTVAAAARYWQDATARTVGQALQIARIHLGQEVPDLDGLPSVALSDGLIDDETELARMLADLDTAEAISTREKVRRLHPEWDDDQIDAEVELIESRGGPPPPPGTAPFGGPRAPGEADVDDEDEDEGDDGDEA